MNVMMIMIINDDDYDDASLSLSLDRIKSLLKLLKKHNVYFGKL